LRRGTVLANLRGAFPEMPEAERRALGKSCYRHFGRFLAEVLMMPGWTGPELAARVRVENAERVRTVLGQGRGVVVVFGHLGNWELLGHAMQGQGFPTALVAKVLRGAVAAHLHEQRQRGYVEFATTGTFEVCLDWLKHGKLLLLAVDQHLARDRAVIAEFLGRPAACSPAPGLFALRAGAAVFHAWMTTTPEGYVVRLEGPLEVPPGPDTASRIQSFTQVIQDSLGAAVRAQPWCWLWLHRRWKAAVKLGR
jgi:KDO2-lipid IV(A) lauroyltransferase